MGDVIGRAFIEVSPDVSKFARQATRDLNKAFRNFKKISVGISVGSVRKAFVEVSKLNTAIRATVLGFTALTAKAVVAGMASVASSAVELSGALGVVPAAAVAGAAALATLKIGLFGVDDVIKAFLKGDMEKFAEKLKDLSPNAQKALGVLKQFKPAIDDLKNSVQDALFAGLDKVGVQLGQKILPRLKLGFAEIADSLNQVVKNVAAFILQKDSLRDIDTTMANVNKSFRTLIPVGKDLAQVIRDVVTVGSEFLPIIAKDLTSGVHALAAFIARARETGALQQFFAKGIEALKQVFRIVVNLGAGLINVFRIADEQGAGFLDSLEKLTAGFARFTGSVEGKNALRDFFRSAHDAATAVLPVFKSIFNLIATDLAPLLASFATIAAPGVTKFIDALGKAIDTARPGIETFAKGFNVFLQAISPALQPLAALVGVIGNLLGVALAHVGPLLEKFITQLSDGLLQVLNDPTLLRSFFALIDATGELFLALIPLLGPLTQLAQVLIPAVVAAMKALNPVIAPLISLLGNLISVATPLIELFVALLTPIAGLITGLAKLATALTSSTTAVLVALGLVTVAAGAFGVALNLMGASAALTGSKLVAFGSTISRIAGFLVSPWGIAVVAGVAALTAFGNKSNAAQAEQDRLKSIAQGVTDVIREQNGVMNDAVRESAAKAAADANLIDTANKLGISSKQVIDAILGQGDAFADLQSKLKSLDFGGDQFKSAFGNDQDSIQKFQDFKKALEGVHDNISRGITQNNQYRDAVGRNAEQVKLATDGMKAWADELDRVFDGLVRTGQVQLSTRESERQLAQAYDDFTEIVAKNGATIDINTAAGRQNQNALDDIARSALGLIKNQRDAGASTESLRANMELARDKFITAAQAAGFLEGQANTLADQLGLIPGNYNAKINVDNVAALGAINGTKELLATLKDKTITLTVEERRAFLKEARFGGLASGGTFTSGQIALVGEEGPELVRFGGSGRVFSNDESEAITRSAERLTARRGVPTPAPRDDGAGRPLDVALRVDLGADVARIVDVKLDKFGRVIATRVRAGVGGAR